MSRDEDLLQNHQDITFLAEGTVTTPVGFVAGAAYAGIKTYAADKLDLGLLLAENPCTTAGMFTTNAVRSPSITVTKENLAKGKVRSLVVNSGNANTCVGAQGLKDARESASLAANHLRLEPEEIAVCSTGIIGVELPMALISKGMAKLELSEDGGHDLARAILTTDSHPKEAGVTFYVNGESVTIGGIAKGVGMIHPNMATMLSFLTTDAEIETELLQKMLKQAVDASFNMVSVDGDTSTNDTVLLFANGKSGAPPILEGTPEARLFQEALKTLCVHLGKELARDGEGATKLIETTVEGAISPEDARRVARTVSSSLLVKPAVHGADPNWGRIVAAIGRSGATVDENKLAVYVNNICLFYMEEGPLPFHKDAVVAMMQGTEIYFRIQLNQGNSVATAWGCDLSEEYVTFNSAYTT